MRSSVSWNGLPASADAIRPILKVFYCLVCVTPTLAASEDDPLSKLGWRATEGAAAGYVEDRACATCHADIYQSYQHVGMARSFAPPSDAETIEDFGKVFFHKPSQRYYQIRKDGEKLVFRRYQHDDKGNPINEFETLIDWVMGSGNRARSYLYQTEWGEMYMLPLGWYSENREWGMSPGFEERGHLGVLRAVKRQCMFCHNALPEVPEGSDQYWRPHRFPKNLPSGTGCQRCHGPGADHIRAALSGSPPETVQARIVNPRKLPPERRDSVCFQCHMLPTVTFFGSRRFDRPDYSFRPGQHLSDYLVHVDIEEKGVKRADRFEINHHGYRFWQSRCFSESKGALACISCHDPHIKPDSKQFRAQVSDVCLGCHENQAKDHTPAMTAGQDCVGCHMPTRRTRDVVLVTMTDHRIARGPFDPKALIQPIQKSDPIISGLELLPWGQPPTGDDAEIYRIAPVLRTIATADAAEALKKRLLRTQHQAPPPYLDLIEARLKLKDYKEAERTAMYLLQNQPQLFTAHEGLGVARLAQGQGARAIQSLQQSIAIQPTPESHYNLALAYFLEKQNEKALEHLDAAIALRPVLYSAWMYKGRVYISLKKWDLAKAALLRSLEIEPANGPAYADLVRVLRRLGENREADRYLKVGLRVAKDPAALQPLKPKD